MEDMLLCGCEVPESLVVHSLEEAREFGAALNYEAIIRPAFTLGGSGAGVSFNREEFDRVVKWGLELSPIHEILVEESVLGWKEYELEVMRDLNDNVVIICSIENFDPMGIHTGDSITVAPAQTLTDKEYQVMRDAAIVIIREIGVDTGGSNIQFAVHPDTGRMVVIEMNPRVSRSSALASKPRASPRQDRGQTRRGLQPLTKSPTTSPAKPRHRSSPLIDYCVTKIPRWAFEKFPGADNVLTVQMKSVGEAMSIGRTFKESLQKGLRSLEIGRFGLGADGKDRPLTGNPDPREEKEAILRAIRIPRPDRIFQVARAFRLGAAEEEVYDATKIDPWFLRNLREIIEEEAVLCEATPGDPAAAAPRSSLRHQPVRLTHGRPPPAKRARYLRDLQAVDTCAAEFRSPPTHTAPSDEDEVRPPPATRYDPRRRTQPHRQVSNSITASMPPVLKEDGFETIMVNSNQPS